MEEHTLSEIMDTIKKKLNSTLKIDSIRKIEELLAERVNPATSIGVSMLNEVLDNYKDYKLSQLLVGLSTDLDVEKQINELYSYVKSGPDNAILVANLFHKTVNAESVRVCVIYGMILAEHLKDSRTFSFEELIICRALENATDYDLNNFIEIMDKHVQKIDGQSRKKIIYKNMNETIKNKLDITINWCVSNRIFYAQSGEYDEKAETILMDTIYYATHVSDILAYYIRKVNQIWNYDVSD